MPFLMRRDSTKKIWHAPPDQFDVQNKLPLLKAFFGPVQFGQRLTQSVLDSVPDPYVVSGLMGADVPDIFGDDLGPWHVSERVMAVIEELEPGLHSFIPINVMKDGSKQHVRHKYFVLHTTRFIDAVVFEETEFQGQTTRAHTSGAISRRGPCVLDSSKIRGSHLWRGGICRAGLPGGGGDPLWHHYFASDVLVERLKELKARGWTYQECELR